MAFDNVMKSVDTTIEELQTKQDSDHDQLAQAIGRVEELKLRINQRQNKLDEFAAAKRLLDGAYDTKDA